MKYYIDCDYDVMVGSDNEPSNKPYDGYSHEARVNHRFKVSTTPLQYPEATIETDIEDPIFVVVIYSDGGTFGRTDGYVRILGAVEKSDIDKVLENIYKERKYEKFLGRDPLAKYFSDDTKYFYRCWEGYFASLEGVVLLDSNGFSKYA